MSEQMGEFETGAWAAMLADALTRYRSRTHDNGTGDTSVRVDSFEQAEKLVRSWPWFSTEAVWLPEVGPAVRVGGLSELESLAPWPPVGVIGAVDGSWVLTPDLELVRLT